MGLGVKQQKIYLNIKEGKIIRRDRTGQETQFTYVEGILAGISKKDREFKGEMVPYWYLDIQDPSGGDLYSLSIHYSSGVAKSIFNALASAENLGKIRIEVYQSGDFTKAVVYNNGARLSWKYPELPPIEELKLGGRTVKDDSKRMEFIDQIAREVQENIKYSAI